MARFAKGSRALAISDSSISVVVEILALFKSIVDAEKVSAEFVAVEILLLNKLLFETHLLNDDSDSANKNFCRNSSTSRKPHILSNNGRRHTAYRVEL